MFSPEEVDQLNAFSSKLLAAIRQDDFCKTTTVINKSKAYMAQDIFRSGLSLFTLLINNKSIIANKQHKTAISSVRKLWEALNSQGFQGACSLFKEIDSESKIKNLLQQLIQTYHDISKVQKITVDKSFQPSLNDMQSILGQPKYNWWKNLKPVLPRFNEYRVGSPSYLNSKAKSRQELYGSSIIFPRYYPETRHWHYNSKTNHLWFASSAKDINLLIKQLNRIKLPYKIGLSADNKNMLLINTPLNPQLWKKLTIVLKPKFADALAKILPPERTGVAQIVQKPSKPIFREVSVEPKSSGSLMRTLGIFSVVAVAVVGVAGCLGCFAPKPRPRIG